ncbi:unnamed protein product [Rhodiola kirilowii]
MIHTWCDNRIAGVEIIFKYMKLVTDSIKLHIFFSLVSKSSSPKKNNFPRKIKSKKALSNAKTSESENVVLAWYSSELLGIAASVFCSSQNTTIESPAPATTGGNEVPLVLDRETVVKSIKDDFSRSYFVTDDKGLQRFKRNCSNFGSLIEKSNMKLTKWEDFEDKGVGHWKFSCVMSFPWKPILSVMGVVEAKRLAQWKGVPLRPKWPGFKSSPAQNEQILTLTH